MNIKGERMKVGYRDLLSVVAGITVLTTGVAASTTETVLSAAAIRPEAIHAAASHSNPYKEGEVLIRYKEGISSEEVRHTLLSASLSDDDVQIETFRHLANLTEGRMVHLKSKTLTTEALIQKLQSDPNIAYVEPNYLYHPDRVTVPNDPRFGSLWGLNNTAQEVNGETGKRDADIDAPEAWKITTGSSDVVIAVIDTGVDYLHEDLKANIWVNPREIPGNGKDDDGNGYVDDIHGIDAIHNSGDPMDLTADDGGHGTHVAGTIAAVGNNGKGIAGVSWHTKVMVCKFLGSGGGSTADAIKCLDYVIDQKKRGVNIVATNNSWGGGKASTALKDAIKASNDAGIVFVAAAGNGGSDKIGDDTDDTPHYPSSYDLPGILSVAATDQDDTLASFSNYGSVSVDLAAPGTNILSTTPRMYSPKQGDLFFDNFEHGMGKWATGGTNSLWAVSSDQESFENPKFPVPSPTHFLSDSPGVYYKPDTNSWAMVNHDIDLSGIQGNVYLGFGSAEYIEGDDCDHAKVEISSDGGATWHSVFDFTGYAYYWINPFNFKIPKAFKTAHFRFRFHMTSDSSVEHDGWLIDNVGIGTTVRATYTYMNGTSMAAPHVTGTMALLASKYPKKSALALKRIILDSVDRKENLRGKTVTGGRLNLNRALNLEKQAVPLTPVYYLLGN